MARTSGNLHLTQIYYHLLWERCQGGQRDQGIRLLMKRKKIHHLLTKERCKTNVAFTNNLCIRKDHAKLFFQLNNNLILSHMHQLRHPHQLSHQLLRHLRWISHNHLKNNHLLNLQVRKGRNLKPLRKVRLLMLILQKLLHLNLFQMKMEKGLKDWGRLVLQLNPLQVQHLLCSRKGQHLLCPQDQSCRLGKLHLRLRKYLDYLIFNVICNHFGCMKLQSFWPIYVWIGVILDLSF